VIVEQIWTGNAYRNFNYLIACPDSGEALAVDPLDHQKCLARAKAKGWKITQILNTHEHGDHTGGNGPMIAATGAKLLAHKNAGPRIDGIDRGLAAGDVIKVGKRLELLALDTPGHTMSHICVLSKTDTPALICGDTLFNAGAGNCHGGGHPTELYKTFADQLSKLPDNTLVYPGHDYMRTIWVSRWTASPTIRKPPRCWTTSGKTTTRSAPWSLRWGWKSRSTRSSA
jgi:hydroxyacylglutathione hydrolase